MPARRQNKQINVKLRHHRIRVLVDRLLIFRFIRQLHGRFWGLAAMASLVTGLLVCFAIRPDMVHFSTAFSDFGNDVRTAPYYAGSIFFASFGLWRWRNYLSHTLKRSRPIFELITLTIIGLYLVALMPVSWEGIPYRLHIFGVGLAGTSMLATVIIDTLLSRPRRSGREDLWRFYRLLSCGLILVGGWLTYESSSAVHHYHVSLLGELLILLGYATWVSMKTYLGEGNRSQVSQLLRSFVLID